VSDKGRLEAFSDGVFAIAITLLILEVRSPQGHGALGRALLREWPSYAAYVVSFATIGIVWVNHHALFERITRVDRRLMFINLGLLFSVSLLPFPTTLLARHIVHTPAADQHLAAAVYSASCLAMGLGFFGLWRYVSQKEHLLMQEVTAAQASAILRRNAVGTVMYLAAIALAFVSAYVSLIVCAGVALFYVFPGRTVTQA